MGILKVLGSSSKGNCYIIESNGEILILEAGVNFKRFVLPEIEWRISSVVGCLCSHRHGDHASYSCDISKWAIQVYGTEDIEYALKLEDKKINRIGNYRIQCIKVNHNVPCYSYIIDCPDDVRILFITDTSDFNYRVKKVNCLMVEANYSEDVILEHAVKNEWSRSASNNHLSIDQAIDVIKRHDTVYLNDIILIHLSDGNSSVDKFKEMVKVETGHDCLIADKGLRVKLKKTDF